MTNGRYLFKIRMGFKMYIILAHWQITGIFALWVREGTLCSWKICVSVCGREPHAASWQHVIGTMLSCFSSLARAWAPTERLGKLVKRPLVLIIPCDNTFNLYEQFNVPSVIQSGEMEYAVHISLFNIRMCWNVTFWAPSVVAVALMVS